MSFTRFRGVLIVGLSKDSICGVNSSPFFELRICSRNSEEYTGTSFTRHSIQGNSFNSESVDKTLLSGIDMISFFNKTLNRYQFTSFDFVKANSISFT